MVKRSEHISKLYQSYLFAEIGRKKQRFLESHPKAHLISLGIGDTTEPVPKFIVQAMTKAAQDLGEKKTYVGYDSGIGKEELRKKISSEIYKGLISPDEIFITDGSKPDIGRLQLLFSADTPIAVQDPVYPAYIATSVIGGKTGFFDRSNGYYHNIIPIPCTAETGFLPDFSKVQRAGLIFFCSPHNPTGVAANKSCLKELLQYAASHHSIIIFDSAYSAYIRHEGIPKSIYEIPESRKFAIETGSFSKMIGFTGVRLGWVVVPKELQFEDGISVIEDWKQIITTFFNGASHIAQEGGIATLSPEGLVAIKHMTDFYLKNGTILKESFLQQGYSVFGGENAPYLWIPLKKLRSWEAFDYLLHEHHLIVTPGIGFGPSGEGFIRISSFANREDIETAAKRIQQLKTIL